MSQWEYLKYISNALKLSLLLFSYTFLLELEVIDIDKPVVCNMNVHVLMYVSMYLCGVFKKLNLTF